MAYFSAPKLENHPLFIIKNHAITILFLFWFKIANEHREFRNYLVMCQNCYWLSAYFLENHNSIMYTIHNCNGAVQYPHSSIACCESTDV